jgi:amino acid adenylation domain-containing protein
MAHYYDSFAAGRSPAPLPSGSYGAFVRRQVEMVAERESAQLSYWRQQLEGVAPWRPIAGVLSVEHASSEQMSFDLPQELQRSLEALAAREGTTLFTVLLAAFKASIARYSGRHDICVGTPVANRFGDDCEGLVGCFVNTLAIRVRVATTMRFRELVRLTSEIVLAAREHQDVTWERVVKDVNPRREAGRLPIFQVLFVYHGFALAPLALPGLSVRSTLVGTGASAFELMMFVDGVEGRVLLEYRPEAVDSATVAAMARLFTDLLEGAVCDPDRLLAEWHAPEAPEPVAITVQPDAAAECGLHELFEKQAARTPHAIAIVSLRGAIDYSTLDVTANAVAAILREHGVTPGALVALALERSQRAVVAMLAVLKTGAAFVPIDIRWPSERVRLVLGESRAMLLLTEERFVERSGGVCPTLSLDRLEEESPPRQSVAAVDVTVAPRDLAYVLYTSGSTGRPKGVLIEHAAICNQIAWRQSEFPLTSADAVLQSTALTFDPSVWEIFGPLAAGATIIICDGEPHDGAVVQRMIRAHEVSVLQVVPSVLRSLLAQRAFEGCRSLRQVFCGGEPLDAPLRKRFLHDVEAELINLYGATETAIDALFHRCRAEEPGEVTPIGQPIAHTRVHVVDESLRPVPDGVPGELCVAGRGIARGYLDDPELTAQKFVAAPALPTAESHAFLTGDLVRRLPNGEFEFLGRRDRQLKVRGHRIEPLEVELALRRHPAVRDAAVDVRGEADSSLVAWIVPAAGDRPSHAEMKAFLAVELPAFMLPDRHEWVEALPRLPSGKIDTRKLADRIDPYPSIVPRTDEERSLVQLWEQMLDTRGISVEDNFFDLGGHSLLAVLVAARMSELLGREVRLSDLVMGGTIAGVLAMAADTPAEGREH